MATPGRGISSTPATPNASASQRKVFSRSRRNTVASSAVQIGMVNSMANASANGIAAMAKNQPSCPPKCARLRHRCSPSRCVRNDAAPNRATSSPTTLRTNRIWKVLSSLDSSRPPSAIDRNDSSAPHPQRGFA